jgi:hypothetical protein
MNCLQDAARCTHLADALRLAPRPVGNLRQEQERETLQAAINRPQEELMLKVLIDGNTLDELQRKITLTASKQEPGVYIERAADHLGTQNVPAPASRGPAESVREVPVRLAVHQ